MSQNGGAGEAGEEIGEDGRMGGAGEVLIEGTWSAISPFYRQVSVAQATGL